MAWIEYSEGLRDHFKLHRLARLLGVRYTEALGALSCLWLWAVTNARNGDLRKFSDEELVYAARWEGDPKKLVPAMIETVLLNKNKTIHDWDDHGLRLLNNARERMRSVRERSRTVIKHPRTVERKRVGKKVSKKEVRELPTDDFEKFWSVYPRKVGRENAIRAWWKAVPSRELAEVIVEAVKDQKRWPQWVKDGGQFIPHPATWLNGKRWEDQSPSEAAMVAGGAKPRSVAEELSPEQRARLKALTEKVGRDA